MWQSNEVEKRQILAVAVIALPTTLRLCSVGDFRSAELSTDNSSRKREPKLLIQNKPPILHRFVL